MIHNLECNDREIIANVNTEKTLHELAREKEKQELLHSN